MPVPFAVPSSVSGSLVHCYHAGADCDFWNPKIARGGCDLLYIIVLQVLLAVGGHHRAALHLQSTTVALIILISMTDLTDTKREKDSNG